MSSTLKMPDREQRLYTHRDYKEALSRAGGNSAQALRQEEARGCGFGFLYLDMLNKTLSMQYNSRMHHLLRQVNQGAYGRDGWKRLCEALNKEFNMVRNVLAQAMQAYIRHKGYIDAWPVPGIGKGVSAHGWDGDERTEDVEIPFYFFASSFRVEEDGNRYTITRYSDLYLAEGISGTPYPEELTKRDERIKELKRVKKPTKKQRITSNFKMGAALLPLIVLALFAAALALWYITGADPKEIIAGMPMEGWMGYAALPLLLLIALPAVFYPFLCLHPAVLWGSVIALLVTGLFATAMLVSALDAEWITKKEYLAGVEAAEELEQLENDERYAQMRKEYFQQCKEDKAFAYMWQAEWLAVCKKYN